MDREVLSLSPSHWSNDICACQSISTASFVVGVSSFFSFFFYKRLAANEIIYQLVILIKKLWDWDCLSTYLKSQWFWSSNPFKRVCAYKGN